MTAIRFAAVAAAAALGLTAPAAALAQDARAQPTAVSWDDLDVTTAAGAAELDSRINTAARRACRGMRATGTNMSQVGFCRSQIRDSVLGRMDQPTREAYTRASGEARRGGRP